jgi:hypothetical protein
MEHQKIIVSRKKRKGTKYLVIFVVVTQLKILKQLQSVKVQDQTE